MLVRPRGLQRSKILDLGRRGLLAPVYEIDRRRHQDALYF